MGTVGVVAVLVSIWSRCQFIPAAAVHMAAVDIMGPSSIPWQLFFCLEVDQLDRARTRRIDLVWSNVRPRGPCPRGPNVSVTCFPPGVVGKSHLREKGIWSGIGYKL